MAQVFLNSTQKFALYKLQALFYQAKVPFDDQKITLFVRDNVSARKVMVLGARFFPVKNKKSLTYKVRNCTVSIRVLETQKGEKILINFKKEEEK